MYRRIQLITHFSKPEPHDYIGGIMGISTEPVIDAWFYKLRGAMCNIPRNSRFYFTEKGWKEVGRAVVSACQKSGQDYRIIRVKENSVHVVWRDKFTGYEIAAQPKKERK